MSEFIKIDEYTGQTIVPVQAGVVEKAKKLFKNNWGKILAIICSYILGVFGSDATKEAFDKTLNQTLQFIELVETFKTPEKTTDGQ